MCNSDEGVKTFRKRAKDEKVDSVHCLYHPDLRSHSEIGAKDGTGLEWAHHEKVIVIDQSQAFIGGIDIAPDRFDVHGRFPLIDDDPENPIWKGKDFGNHHIWDLEWRDFHVESDAMKDRSKVVRCPWQDIAVQLWGEAARDTGRHFIERWNYTKRQLKKHKTDSDYPYIMPKADAGMYLNMPSQDEKNADQTRDLNESEIFEAETQVVRSSSPWSAGFKIDVEAEHSILLGNSLKTKALQTTVTVDWQGIREQFDDCEKAYRKIINESKRFIYIENQFFVSTSSLQQNTIQNEVSKYIAERIILAHMREESYKVYIVLPEKSGFSGKLEERTAAEQELFFHLQMHSIYRGKNSIQAYLDDWNLKQGRIQHFRPILKLRLRPG